MNVCDECGVNTEILSGHSVMCSQYVKPLLTREQQDVLRGLEAEDAKKLRAFSDAVNDVVIERGEKSLLVYLARIGITKDDPGFDQMMMLAHMCLAIGAGITIQVMIEQDIIDQQALRRAAGV